MRPATLSDAASNDERPAGITAVAITFVAASLYLLVLGLIKLRNPEAIPLSLGDPLLHGLETYGPYMFLLAGGLGVGVAYGLFRLKNLARRAAIVICVAGMVLLIPKVSADTAEFSASFFLKVYLPPARSGNKTLYIILNISIIKGNKICYF